jgi:hypothetical protein
MRKHTVANELRIANYVKPRKDVKKGKRRDKKEM